MNMKNLLAVASIAWLLLSGAPAEASDITAEDCAIGGVQAGWHGTYPEIPEAFMDTCLKDAAWEESPIYIRALLEDFPEKSMMYMRVSEDMSLSLTGIRVPQTGENQSEGKISADEIYIEAISVWNAKETEKSKTYKRLAKDLQTPRGIHIGSTLEDVQAAYGPEDFKEGGKSGGGFYCYYTKETLAILEKDEKYMGGVGIVFLINGKTGKVTNITVTNSTGK